MDPTAEWTPLEIKIGSVWKEVLNIGALARDHNFIEMGGSSLQAVKIAFKCQRLLGRSVTAAQVMRAGTVAALARALDDGAVSGCEAA
ncbi:hypothetical protein GCM10027277_47240 [Pseudoduganella ginsengisoli]|uniref:Carrier domain-containing protein n=1 Tax=Pseudoduganella ginsengisoli TaxID=1462440 RepID=A0A6L6Q4E5_9BURK|nr:phosphopantetheine-binding protein [Pseudoduganella ginsengisoli]MTW04088.1 hypothetical protein [Pseudoduganella ginsengisoli]